jgi:Xaa-Pro aminopeptidase
VPMKYSFPKDEALDIQFSENIRLFESHCVEQNLDLCIVGSADSFLSEYNPLCNNQRFALSGFTGSVGDGVFISTKASVLLNMSSGFYLSVDGRYHTQAELECSALLNSGLILVKNDLQTNQENWLEEFIKTAEKKYDKPANKPKLNIGIDLSRTTYLRFTWLQKLNLNIQNIETWNDTLNLKGWRTNRPIVSVSEHLTGRTISSFRQELKKHINNKFPNYAFLTCSSDDASFILNSRGYHLPYHSSVLAYTITTQKNFYLHLPFESELCDTPEEFKQQENFFISRGSLSALKTNLLAKEPLIENICFLDSAMNAVLPALVQSLFPKAKFENHVSFLSSTRALKTPQELKTISSAFLKSSNAIAKTIREAKYKKETELFSEFQLSELLSLNYQQQGAVGLSFKTIAGTGPNGAIIHYGEQSPNVYIRSGDIVLLDSGAYYDGGFATDCTRGYFKCGQNKHPETWQKEIYTVCLKAFMEGMTSEFAVGTLGKTIDENVRNVCKKYNYNYGHGTGHGVGILVHESGARISSASEIPLLENVVVSMEPGIYIEGKGGVRIENVVVVKKLANGKLGFENLVWVGFDEHLIDTNLLNEKEKNWLAWYKSECDIRGNGIME